MPDATLLCDITKIRSSDNRRKARSRAGIPLSRPAKLTQAIETLKELKVEADAWIAGRPDDYEEKDGNEDRLANMEAYADVLEKALDELEELVGQDGNVSIPKFRLED